LVGRAECPENTDFHGGSRSSIKGAALVALGAPTPNNHSGKHFTSQAEMKEKTMEYAIAEYSM
jgi:hypothetical protein